MFFKRLTQQIKSCVVRVVRNIEQRFKQWTKPSNESLVAGTLADVMRGKGELIAKSMYGKVTIEPNDGSSQVT